LNLKVRVEAYACANTSRIFDSLECSCVGRASHRNDIVKLSVN
jgi:hypothetical protein